MSRAEYEALHMTANGRPVKVVKANSGSTCFVLKYSDDKQGNMPHKYAGMYTSEKLAETARDLFVKETWDVAEEMVLSKRKRA